MVAVALAGHDPKPRRLGAVINMISGAAITKGAVVGYHATGIDFTVYNFLSASNVCPVGIALHSTTAAGEKVAVASFGSIVRVQNGVNSALEAGDAIMGDETTAGTIKAYTSAAGGEEPIGFMLEAIAGDNVPKYAYIAPGVKGIKQT